MTFVSDFLKEVAYTSVPQPVGTQTGNDDPTLVTNPNDAKLGTRNQMDIEDQSVLAERIGNIVDSLDDDDITDQLAGIVEQYLETVDPGANLSTQQAALMLPLEDCQDLYEELTKYLDDNDIDYSEDKSFDDVDLPAEVSADVPSDLYPDSSNYIMGGNSAGPPPSVQLGY